MIDYQRLRELLKYYPDTGLFVWRVDKGRAKKGDIAGTLSKSGYIRIKLDGKKYMAHKLAYIYMGLNFPKIVDHKDGNPANNSWRNLRICSHTENHYNQKLRKDSGTGIKNVKAQPNGKYAVRVTRGGKRYFEGSFNCIELAELVACEMRELLHGTFSRDY